MNTQKFLNKLIDPKFTIKQWNSLPSRFDIFCGIYRLGHIKYHSDRVCCYLFDNQQHTIAFNNPEYQIELNNVFERSLFKKQLQTTWP